MKVPFKSLSLAAAVAAASIGYAGIANAQSLANNEGLGDLAIVPYYTVQGSWSTGVDIINTSDATQVIKIRLRRAVDSMDALDFNVVMSPKDVWTGYVQKAPEGDEIRFYSNDTSCTVPAFSVTDPEVNYFVMPDIYRLGAEEGYIEVIGMGSTITEAQPIAVDAKHNSSGIPKDCVRVRDNFFRGNGANGINPSVAYYADTATALGNGRTRGVINSALTHQYTSSTNLTPVPSAYTDTDNVLKVSWFIKSDETGTEFGGDAVHIADFMDGASITNQQVGVNEGDLQGFDHPDLNGGAPFSVLSGFDGAGYNRYEGLREALGASEVINDWSANTGGGLFTVNTDWVITTPGQYVMTNLPEFILSLEDDDEECTRVGAPNACDNRDIPMTVSALVYDREEGEIQVDENDLVISPQPPGVPTVVQFDQEVNVVRWTESVLDAQKAVIIPTPEGANAGWASVSVTSSPGTGICEYTDILGATPAPMTCSSTFSPAPLVGFVAWERNFESQPDANFGRSVDHSYATGSIN